MAWRSYKHRFVPWILWNYSFRGPKKCGQDSPADSQELYGQFRTIIDSLHQSLTSCCTVGHEVSYSTRHLQDSFAGRTELYNKTAKVTLYTEAGFVVEKGRSMIEDAGRGVLVTKGVIQPDQVVAIYPGLTYSAGDPVLLQSICNQFMFRCQDGVLIDGNDRYLSKLMYRSCAGRDILGSNLMCDISWLGDYPINPLAIGQYINNCTTEFPANVEYVELDVPEDFPWHLLKYVPNNHYNSDIGHTRFKRIILLRSLRTIKQGEELFSTYFSLVR